MIHILKFSSNKFKTKKYRDSYTARMPIYSGLRKNRAEDGREMISKTIEGDSFKISALG